MDRIAKRMEERRTLSFEMFSPKTDREMEQLVNTMKRLSLTKPDYFSCTYGAGGSSTIRNLETLQTMKKVCPDITRVAHLTCIGHTEHTMYGQLQTYLDNGVTHILALRGDLPEGMSTTGGDLQYATDLVAFTRHEFGDMFEIAVTGLPEGHPESVSPEQDIEVLLKKQELGADYIITQLTFDMPRFAEWLAAIRKAGVTMPVDVGVMPVLSRNAVLTQCLSRNGCAIPPQLARLISRHWFDTEPDGSPDRTVRAAFREAGIAYTVDQIRQYQAMDIQGIHLYAMNRWMAVTEILSKV